MELIILVCKKCREEFLAQLECGPVTCPGCGVVDEITKIVTCSEAEK